MADTKNKKTSGRVTASTSAPIPEPSVTLVMPISIARHLLTEVGDSPEPYTQDVYEALSALLED
jgi:hypothetical protein